MVGLSKSIESHFKFLKDNFKFKNNQDKLFLALMDSDLNSITNDNLNNIPFKHNELNIDFLLIAILYSQKDTVLTLIKKQESLKTEALLNSVIERDDLDILKVVFDKVYKNEFSNTNISQIITSSIKYSSTDNLKFIMDYFKDSPYLKAQSPKFLNNAMILNPAHNEIFFTKLKESIDDIADKSSDGVSSLLRDTFKNIVNIAKEPKLNNNFISDVFSELTSWEIFLEDIFSKNVKINDYFQALIKSNDEDTISSSLDSLRAYISEIGNSTLSDILMVSEDKFESNFDIIYDYLIDYENRFNSLVLNLDLNRSISDNNFKSILSILIKNRDIDNISTLLNKSAVRFVSGESRRGIVLKCLKDVKQEVESGSKNSKDKDYYDLTVLFKQFVDLVKELNLVKLNKDSSLSNVDRAL